VIEAKGRKKGAGNAVCTLMKSAGAHGEPEMLDAYVIEEIKRRERQRDRDERPAVELPVPPPAERGPRSDEDPPGGNDRGVVIIDYN
jgi:hypothetical protein